MKKLTFFIFYWVPPLVVMITIFMLSSRQRISVADTYAENFIIFKTLHILEYSLLYFLIFRAYYRTFTKMTIKQIYVFAILSSILYAASDEMHQTFTPTREGSPRDIVIDTIGILSMT